MGEKNNPKTWLEANGWGQTKVFKRKEQLNTGTAGLVQFSRRFQTLVGLIIGHSEVNYPGRGFPIGTAGSEEWGTTTHILCYSETLSNKRRWILGNHFIEELCFKVEETQELLQFWGRFSSVTRRFKGKAKGRTQI